MNDEVQRHQTVARLLRQAPDHPLVLGEIDAVADILDRAVGAKGDATKLASLKAEVSALCTEYPLFAPLVD